MKYSSKIAGKPGLQLIDDPNAMATITRNQVGTSSGTAVTEEEWAKREEMYKLLHAAIPQGVSGDKIKPKYADVIADAKKAIEVRLPSTGLCMSRAISNRMINTVIRQLGSSGKRSYFKELMADRIREEDGNAVVDGRETERQRRKSLGVRDRRRAREDSTEEELDSEEELRVVSVAMMCSSRLSIVADGWYVLGTDDVAYAKQAAEGVNIKARGQGRTQGHPASSQAGATSPQSQA